jgi:MFS family permease
VRRFRRRLAALWAAQGARAGADACLRLFVVLLAAEGPAAQRESTWHLVMALFMLPCVVLAPLNGAIGNSLPKRAVLVGAAAYGLLATLAFGWAGGPWLAGLAVVALGSAVFMPTRFALLPAAAADARLPLARVVGWIEAGALLAMVGGLVVAGRLAGRAGPAGVPATVWAIWGLGLLCLLAALPASFPADVRRPEPLRAALRGFFDDARRIGRDPAALAALLGLALFRGVVAIAVGALIAATLARHAGGAASAFDALLSVALVSMVGAGAGSVLAGLPADRRRALALVPLGAAGIALALGWAAAAPGVPVWLGLLVGTLGGAMNVPLLVAYQCSVPADARGNGMAILNTAGYLSVALLSLAMAAASAFGLLSASGQLVATGAIAAAGAGLAVAVLRRRPPPAAAATG